MPVSHKTGGWREGVFKKGALISDLDLPFTRFILIPPKPHKPPIHRQIRLVRLQ